MSLNEKQGSHLKSKRDGKKYFLKKKCMPNSNSSHF